MSSIIGNMASTERTYLRGARDMLSGDVQRGLTPFSSSLKSIPGMSPAGFPSMGSIGKPKYGTTNEDMINLSRVVFQVPIRVPMTAEGFYLREGDYLMVWNPKSTIEQGKTSVYSVLTLSGINEKINLLEQEAHEKVMMRIQKTKKGPGSSMMGMRFKIQADQKLLKSGPDGASDLNVDISTISKYISFIGVMMTDMTPGTSSNRQITKNVAGELIVSQHEGRQPIPNLWGNVSSGSHVNFVLTKIEGIEPSNPLKYRAHQMVPSIGCSSTGINIYHNYGIPVADHTGLHRSGKRGRFDTQMNFGSSSKSGINPILSGFSSPHIFSQKYRRYSTIIHADDLNKYGVTGTIYSVNRKESTLSAHTKDDINVKRIPCTFLDYGVCKYGFEHTNKSGSGLDKSMEIYGVNIWSMTREPVVVYPVGVVLTGPRGGAPNRKIEHKVIFSDNHEQGENVQTLKRNNHIYVHIRPVK